MIIIMHWNIKSRSINYFVILSFKFFFADSAVSVFQVSLEAVQGLSLLLEGSANPVKAIHPVHKLLTKAPLQAQAGYSKLSRSFPLQQLLTCLRQNLTVNPFGITACLHSGKKLTWAQQGE